LICSVFVVDPHPDLLKMTTLYLGSLDGIKVVGSVTSGDQALALISELQPHIVVAEMWLPGRSFREFVTSVRAALRHVGIVLTAGASCEAEREAALAAGADAFVAKERLIPGLEQAIQNLCRTRLRAVL
jgi:DNA-binding NarL/FixJ family response regulator